MTTTVRANGGGTFVLVDTNSGNMAYTTASEVFVTTDAARATEAAAYVNQDVTGGKKRTGPHWLKSTFGVF
jgi:predicted 3-demethylubiquinone-9 3-methyltransferase (glyoxalase superfamily)